MRRYCLALDLKDDPVLIAEYKAHHQVVWPEVIDSLKEAGIEELEIYLVENRLFMIMEVNPTFSFERKTEIDSSNETVQAWEELMWKYQQKLPMAKQGEKWMLMERIYNLKDKT